MFDIGFSELLLIALLALLVLGPKRLPEAARAAGRTLGRLRRFMTGVKRDFDRELNTAELDELRQLKMELDETRRAIHDSTHQAFQSVAKIGADTETTIAPPAASAAAKTKSGKRRARAPRSSKDGDKHGGSKRTDGR